MSHKPRKYHSVEDKENIKPGFTPTYYDESSVRAMALVERERFVVSEVDREREKLDRSVLRNTTQHQQKIKERTRLDELSQAFSKHAKIIEESDEFILMEETPKKKRLNNLLRTSAMPNSIRSSDESEASLVPIKIVTEPKAIPTKSPNIAINEKKLNSLEFEVPTETMSDSNIVPPTPFSTPTKSTPQRIDSNRMIKVHRNSKNQVRRHKVAHVQETPLKKAITNSIFAERKKILESNNVSDEVTMQDVTSKK